MKITKSNVSIGATLIILLNYAIFAGGIWLLAFVAHLGWNAAN